MTRLAAAVAALLAFAATPALAAEDAAALYNQKCAACHGKDGKAMKMGSPDLTKSKDAAAIENVVANGKGKMMAFKGKLTPEQIKAVAAHVQTLK